MRPSPKVELARRLAQDLIAEPDVLAVLLVGSVAIGTDSEDSDVDLAVILDRELEISEEYRQHGNVRVGIERYPARLFADLPAAPVYDLEGLRNAGRFARGVVLASRWPRLEAIRAAWENARLDPAEVAELLDLAATYLEPSRLAETDSEEDRLWLLQGAAGAIAMLTLVREPCRFQKPKWLMHDLEATGHHGLAGDLRRLYMNDVADAAGAAHALAAAAEHLAAACRLAGWPPLSFDPAQGARRVYVYQTFRDAASLEAAGDFAGATFTAVYSLRLVHAHLQSEPPDAAPISDEALAAWRAAALAATLPGGLPPPARLDETVASLAGTLAELHERFRA